jgi:hypothetical protein
LRASVTRQDFDTSENNQRNKTDCDKAKQDPSDQHQQHLAAPRLLALRFFM